LKTRLMLEKRLARGKERDWVQETCIGNPEEEPRREFESEQNPKVQAKVRTDCPTEGSTGSACGK